MQELAGKAALDSSETQADARATATMMVGGALASGEGDSAAAEIHAAVSAAVPAAAAAAAAADAPYIPQPTVGGALPSGDNDSAIAETHAIGVGAATAANGESVVDIGYRTTEHGDSATADTHAVRVGPGAANAQRPYMAKKKPLRNWSDEELEELRAIVTEEGEGNWDKKSAAFSTQRTPGSLRKKWEHLQEERQDVETADGVTLIDRKTRLEVGCPIHVKYQPPHGWVTGQVIERNDEPNGEYSYKVKFPDKTSVDVDCASSYVARHLPRPLRAAVRHTTSASLPSTGASSVSQEDARNFNVGPNISRLRKIRADEEDADDDEWESGDGAQRPGRAWTKAEDTELANLCTRDGSHCHDWESKAQHFQGRTPVALKRRWAKRASWHTMTKRALTFNNNVRRNTDKQMPSSDSSSTGEAPVKRQDRGQECPKCLPGSGKLAGHLGRHLIDPDGSKTLSDKELLVCRRFTKEFKVNGNIGDYPGTVISYSDEDELLFQVAYDDGDAEDLNMAQLQECLIKDPSPQWCSIIPGSVHKANGVTSNGVMVVKCNCHGDYRTYENLKQHFSTAVHRRAFRGEVIWDRRRPLHFGSGVPVDVLADFAEWADIGVSQSTHNCYCTKLRQLFESPEKYGVYAGSTHPVRPGSSLAEAIDLLKGDPEKSDKQMRAAVNKLAQFEQLNK
jgi:hypothetical protein